MTEDIPLAELRPRLIAAMLPNVPFDGWTATSRDLAADAEGIDRDIAAMALPDAATMIDAYTEQADALMTAAMANAHDLKVRDRIRLALRSRLEAADREAVRRALAVLLQPQHAGLSARTLWRTADAMWRAAGDTATDFNHYSKRAILGAVYSASLLYWLEDDSDEQAATWAFIDRRIDDVMKFEKTKARVQGALSNLPNPAGFLGRLRYPAV
ncbi:MAG: COQ9 family protein [Alphaproteobacteria bacterium]|nr:MAG: COQ9 family protein [Alphaproteobacteria bacterium]